MPHSPHFFPQQSVIVKRQIEDKDFYLCRLPDVLTGREVYFAGPFLGSEGKAELAKFKRTFFKGTQIRPEHQPLTVAMNGEIWNGYSYIIISQEFQSLYPYPVDFDLARDPSRRYNEITSWLRIALASECHNYAYHKKRLLVRLALMLGVDDVPEAILSVYIEEKTLLEQAISEIQRAKWWNTIMG